MGDQGRIAVVRDERGQGIDQAKAFVRTGQQQDAAVGTDLTGIKAAVTFFLPILGRENGRSVSSASVGIAILSGRRE